MSVLAFPRLYFNGYMQWNVDTTNNNDYVPVYDAADAALDWAYLATMEPPITPSNFQEAFRPWVVQPTSDSCPPSDPGQPNQDNCNDNPTCHMASRWNYYGNQGCSFVQYQNYVTVTTGGALAYDQPAASGDPILNQQVKISGRLVDINPVSPFCSQIYFNSITAGSSTTYIGGPQYQRMYSRSFLAPRNIASDLIIAGAVGTIFQTTIPTTSVTSANGGNSPLLTALLKAIQAQGAAGLMIRMSAYNTLYYQNGIFNGTTQQPRTCDELTQMYQNGEVFTNPAYSRIVGVIGVWNTGELSTAPGGRMLVPNATVAPPSSTVAVSTAAPKVKVEGHARVRLDAAPAISAASVGPQPPAALALGTIMAEVNASAGIVSLDFLNAIPEYTSSGTKFDYGSFDVGVQMPDNSFNLIGSFDSDQYDQSAYEANGGLVDVPFASGVTASDVKQWAAEGLLALRNQGNIVSLELPLTVQTDDRGIYLDECRVGKMTLQVLYKGAPAPAGTQVAIAQYYPWPLIVATGEWVLFGTTPPSGGDGPFCNVTPAQPYLAFPGGNTVTVGAGGTATVLITSQAAGFPIVAFYPYLAGTPAPALQPQVTFSFVNYQTYTIGTAFFTAVRALPFDNALVAQFVDCWNATGSYAGQPQYNENAIWQFIYNNIFYIYDMLYPAMDQIIPLGNQQAVQQNIKVILQRISETIVDTTGFMPVTREMSAAKRLILDTWGGLVLDNFPQKPLPPIKVPCDVT
ncbi:MAG TPA: hypothetical protein VH394_21865 [Thermoanaerobaculia bacterium]|jgi:hypothetical protein|nr:hypothetical protein [Thermoanaerobaculia bacterium]